MAQEQHARPGSPTSSTSKSPVETNGADNAITSSTRRMQRLQKLSLFLSWTVFIVGFTASHGFFTEWVVMILGLGTMAFEGHLHRADNKRERVKRATAEEDTNMDTTDNGTSESESDDVWGWDTTTGPATNNITPALPAAFDWQNMTLRAGLAALWALFGGVMGVVYICLAIFSRQYRWVRAGTLVRSVFSIAQTCVMCRMLLLASRERGLGAGWLASMLRNMGRAGRVVAVVCRVWVLTIRHVTVFAREIVREMKNV